MGTEYSTEAISGYNATPPADDGTVSEANKVKWSTIKTKLPDPLKTAIENIDTKLVSHFDRGPIAVTTNTTLGASHFNKIVQVSGSGVTLTLTDAATLTAGWYCDIVSTDATNNVALARATASNTINETSADVTILPLQELRVIVNAAANGFLVNNKARHSKAFKTVEDYTHSGTVTMSGKSIYEANASVAANATASDIWSGGNYVTLTGGAVTFTDFADAPQAGVEVELYCNAAHVFTDNANLEIDGDANFTAEAGDRVRVRSKSTTVFTLMPVRKSEGAISVGNHSVVVHTGNGWGSTNTKIRRYTTVLTNVGTAITYADSAANGASFTINETGLYCVYISDTRDADVEYFGASVNSAELTTVIDAIAIANRIMLCQENVLGRMAACSIVRRFSASDVIRPHGEGGSANATNKVQFSVTKVSS